MKALKVSGVYVIRCIATGKVYVGSSVCLYNRWRDHRRELRKRNHCNSRLQQAWDTYGEANFEFLVLELVEREYLMETEQSWIDRARCFEPGRGFNISPVAGSTGELFAKVWEGFIDPNGSEVLKAFCREHGLDATHMVAVLKGRICSHYGWTHRDGRKPQDERTYTGFINPAGQRVTITNLAGFCREYGLHPVKMHNLKSGKIKRYRDWTWKEEETDE